MNEYLLEKAVDRGFESLSEAELLGLLLNSPELGEELIKRFGSFKGIAGQLLEKLLAIPGMGGARVSRLAAAFEIAKRCVEVEKRGR